MVKKNDQKSRPKGGRKQQTKVVLQVRKGPTKQVRRRTMRTGMRNVSKRFNPESRLAAKFMLPGKESPVRLPTEPPQTTALWKFEQIIDLNFTTVGERTDYLVFKDLVYPLWQHRLSTAAVSAYNTFTFTGTTPVCPITFGQLEPSPITVAAIPSLSFTRTSGTWPADWAPVLPTAVDKDNRVWFYVPNDALPSVRFVTTGGALTGGSWTVRIMVTTDGVSTNATYLNSVATASGSQTASTVFPASDGGWYSLHTIECSGSATTPTSTWITTIDVGFTSAGTLASPTAGSIRGFYPVNGLGLAEHSVAPSIYEQARMNAGCFLFQNTSANVDLAGGWKAAVLKVSGSGLFDPDRALIAASNVTASKRDTGKIAEGFYCYFWPEMCEDTFRDVTYGNLVGKQVFNMDQHQFAYHVTATATAVAQETQVVYITHHEALCDNMLFQTGLCVMPREEYRQAKIGVEQTIPFSENPIHLAKFTALAARAGAAAWQRLRPYANPLAHRAVDYLIPKYRALELTERTIPRNY